MIATTTDRPRGKNQRERWYQAHTRPAEVLFVVELPNGSLGKHNGAVGVSARRDVMEAVVDRCAMIGRVVAVTFREGARVHRLADFTAVDRLFS